MLASVGIITTAGGRDTAWSTERADRSSTPRAGSAGPDCRADAHVVADGRAERDAGGRDQSLDRRALARLHSPHRICRLPTLFEPPSAIGMMWSYWMSNVLAHSMQAPPSC